MISYRRKIPRLLSPLHLFAALLALIFAVEATVMFLLHGLSQDQLPFWLEALLDAALLTAICTPFLWRYFLSPLQSAVIAQQVEAKAIMDTAADGIITIDEHGVIQSFNRAAEKIFGYEEDEAVGQSAGMLMTSVDRQRYGADIERHLRADRNNIIGNGHEVAGRRKDGEIIPLEVSVAEINLGNQRLFTGIVQDITERKRRTAIESLLHEIDQHILQGQELSQLLRFACSHLAALLGYPIVWIGKREAGGGVHVLAYGGSVDEYPKEFMQIGVRWDDTPQGKSPTGAAIRSGRVQVLQTDDPAFQLWREAARKYQLQSVISLPLVIQGETYGAFTLYSKHPDTFAAAETVRWLSDVAGRISVALEMAIIQQHTRHMAHYDALTDLPNRWLFYERLHQTIVQAKRHGHQIAVLFLDLDRFKLINDSLGHAVGDLLLQQAAKRIKDCVRESDTVARLGGDEFTVILPHIAGRVDAMPVVEKICAALSQPFLLAGHEVATSTSIGIAIYPGDADNEDELVRRADTSMYAAKTGGSCYRFSSGGEAAR